jgi:hypothetical protein
LLKKTFHWPFAEIPLATYLLKTTFRQRGALAIKRVSSLPHFLCPTWRTGKKDFKALMKKKVPACSVIV